MASAFIASFSRPHLYAELHEGERVLTKQQNREYNEGRTGQSGDVFNFYNTKPTPYEYARQMKKAKRDLALGY